MLAHERSGPVGRTPLLLIHAGIADRRMWDPVWPALTAVQDVVRLDLRGYGESTAQPVGPWSPRADVLATLDSLGIGRVHVVGCSFGAGVAVEVALERPEAVASLVLVAPGGALLTERTDELVAFFEAEGNALEAGDLDAAVEANLRAWVDGPRRGPDAVPASVRDKVGAMQRRVFDITGGWPDEVWSAEEDLSPAAPYRYGEIMVPTLVLSGGLDIESIRQAGEHLVAGVQTASAVVWDEVAHLPSMERPQDFAALVPAG
ncbi:alpha/beta fold hydrolase [Sanguibacter antarcticus]|uniref:Pimeloyl-ACP methyl ester carboxylesterase n=1 Tax=Sanguibacter antarcticus TaxID=372484 RepID=A0A2A9E9R5_9MICO|nr:alpha/beta hydrolase [Sanguibacter antarcticus]PFG35301.1 pimeloyl-ACP methyl ester carboxylesterase [Sanguibacter antarcticus]